MKPQPMSESEIVKCLVDAGCIGTVKMTFESGPYDITRTSINADRFARAVEARVNAQWAAMIGEPVAYRVEVDGLWFHARDRGGLITALGVKLGISRSDLQPSPLYAIKETP